MLVSVTDSELQITGISSLRTGNELQSAGFEIRQGDIIGLILNFEGHICKQRIRNIIIEHRVCEVMLELEHGFTLNNG